MKRLAAVISLILAMLCIVSCFAENTIRPESVAAGDVVTFGTYEQDNNLDNGAESIEWIVLDVQNGKALLLSKYALDAIAFNAEYGDIAWDKCTLRSWLNNEFLKEAFSEAEQSAVLLTDVDNSDAQHRWNSVKCDNTQDQIFLLSDYEAFTMYFSSDDARQCILTDYAIANGAWTDEKYQLDGKAIGVWWLRSPGPFQDCTEVVLFGGYSLRMNVDFAVCVIRPAFWIDLNSDIF